MRPAADNPKNGDGATLPDVDDPERLTCPACGFYFEFLDGSAPTHGKLTCEECGHSFEVNPTPPPPDAIQFRGASEINVGAAAIREYVARVRSGSD